MDKTFETDAYGFTRNPARWDYWLAQTAQALIEIGNEQGAAVLLACRIEFELYDTRGDDAVLTATLIGPMSAVGLVCNEDTEYTKDGWTDMCNPLREQVEEVLNLVLGKRLQVTQWAFQVEAAAPLPANWRAELNERLRQQGTTNQGVPSTDQTRKVYDFAGLRYSSASEVSIAKRLENTAGVMYFPNCAARLHRGGERLTRYPDFLICCKGKWGILEVDGKPFHAPSHKADDNERDRLFHQYAVSVVQHYDAKRCWEEPQQVVAEFLDLLVKNG